MTKFPFMLILFILDAEQFGYGNWEDVAKHVETRDSESIFFFVFS